VRIDWLMDSAVSGCQKSKVGQSEK